MLYSEPEQTVQAEFTIKIHFFCESGSPDKAQNSLELAINPPASDPQVLGS